MIAIINAFDTNPQCNVINILPIYVVQQSYCDFKKNNKLRFILL